MNTSKIFGYVFGFCFIGFIILVISLIVKKFKSQKVDNKAVSIFYLKVFIHFSVSVVKMFVLCILGICQMSNVIIKCQILSLRSVFKHCELFAILYILIILYSY